MELSTAVERVRHPALLRREACQPERYLLHEEIKGRQSASNRYLMRGQWETEISLDKGGHCSVKGGCKILGSISRNTNREESGFMIIDGQASSMLQEFKDMFSFDDGFSRAVEEDKGVVGIQKNRARITRDQRVTDGRSKGGVLE